MRGPPRPRPEPKPRQWSITERLERLGAAGLVVSICYGPMGSMRSMRYSVDVLYDVGEFFDAPFAAESLEQCLEIAEIESRKRGWLK